MNEPDLEILAKSRYPAWQAPFRSCFSAGFYRDVALYWSGLGFLYLFLLLGLIWLPLAVRAQFQFNQWITEQVVPIVSQMPALGVKDGKFEIDKPSPYTIKSGGQVLFTYDTTGQTKLLPSFGWLVTDKEISIQSGGGAVKYLAQPDQLIGRVINAKALLDFVNFVKLFLVPILFAVMWPLSFVCCAVQSTIYGLIGKIFQKFWRADLSPSVVIRLAVVALSPWLLLDLILKLANVMPIFNLIWDNGAINDNFLRWGILSSLITLSYLCLAIKANGKFN